eukprot:15431223-Alexandrium_andersonii.AAC.1
MQLARGNAARKQGFRIACQSVTRTQNANPERGTQLRNLSAVFRPPEVQSRPVSESLRIRHAQVTALCCFGSLFRAGHRRAL